MRINELTASFGKLQNDTLRFHEGLNIIYAPNESGKSTLSAMIRAMLYGVNTAERERARERGQGERRRLHGFHRFPPHQSIAAMPAPTIGASSTCGVMA